MLTQMHIGLHMKYPLFLKDIDENSIFETDFEKHKNIKFH